MTLKSTVLLFFFISFSLLVRGNMGTCHSKSDKIKRDKLKIITDRKCLNLV